MNPRTRFYLSSAVSCRSSAKTYRSSDAGHSKTTALPKTCQAKNIPFVGKLLPLVGYLLPFVGFARKQGL